MQKISFFIMMMVVVSHFMSCSDSKTEKDYFDLANEQYGMEAYADAIEYFKIILDKYPEGETAAKSTFMIGFINANSLKNLEEAKKYYTLFVEKYPDHDLADDAEYELKTLGQDVNDLPIFKDMQSGEQVSTGD